MEERDDEIPPWSDPTEAGEAEPDWAREIRERRKARGDSLREVFEGFDGKLSKKPQEPS